VRGRLILATFALCGVALAATASFAATQPRRYTRAATRGCLLRLPNSVAGLPPTGPPVPPTLSVYRLARLSFFKRVPDARVSLKSLA